jgi:hypothetical protein
MSKIQQIINNLSEEEAKEMLLTIVSDTYTLIEWPYSQELMDEEWFDEEASLADFDKHGSSAYFIPTSRTL